MTDVGSEPVILPTDRTSLFDPAEGLGELRRTRPLCPLRYANGDRGWLVTSHALAKAVLTDSRFGRGDFETQRGKGVLEDAARDAEFTATLQPFGDWRPMRGFIGMDPPEHTRYRRLLAPHFTTRRMVAFRPRIERIVADQIDKMVETGPPVDLVSTFAAPVALLSQCILLGVPSEDVGRFFRLGTNLSDPMLAVSEVVSAWREAWEYVRTLTCRRRLEPEDDVISDIARNDELTDDEIADTALVLFQGGLETTGDMLALGVFGLLHHSDQLRALREDPSTIDSTVEELLRYAGVFRVVSRVALESVQTGGTEIQVGETVTVALAAANRDPDRFEHPDELDIMRPATGHVAFGQGSHMCIGQHLARVELQEALLALVQSFPTLRLAIAASDVAVYPDYGNFGVRELPVAW